MQPINKTPQIRLLRYECRLTALTGITHGGGDKNGNINLARREEVITPSQQMFEVPFLSGNSMRAKIFRRPGSEKFMQDLQNTPDEKVVDKKTMRFLATGGSLQSGDSASGVDVDKFRATRENIALVGLLGGSGKGGMIPGIANVNPAIPIVQENMYRIPEKYQIENPLRADQITDMIMNTTKDEGNNPRFMQYVQPFDEEDDKVQNDTSNQMIYYTEYIKAGTQFYWTVTLHNPTEIEYDLFVMLLEQFKQDAKLGGKAGTGFGCVEITDEVWTETKRDGESLTVNGHTAGSLYNQFVSENKAGLRVFLNQL